jgi:hypothetical protein
MNLTFNAPSTNNRMGSTNTKNFSNHTPNTVKKQPHSSHKRIADDKNLFIVGHHPKADIHESVYNAEEYSGRMWGIKRK